MKPLTALYTSGLFQVTSNPVEIYVKRDDLGINTKLTLLAASIKVEVTKLASGANRQVIEPVSSEVKDIPEGKLMVRVTLNKDQVLSEEKIQIRLLA